jgi:hypothetical protein
MAHHGYTAHGGSDGSVPEQRYTEGGGEHYVQENAACFFDDAERALDPSATFEPEALEKIEAAFLNEKPPHDGHRRNLLSPWHNRMGVGLAQPLGIRVPCMSQELVDAYGRYDNLPRRAKLGQTVRVSGEVAAPARFSAVSVARIELPVAHRAQELNKTSTYRVPQPYVTFFPEGFVTPVPVRVSGRRFIVDVPLQDGGRPGIYEVSVWGEVPDASDPVMISLRTVRVE